MTHATIGKRYQVVIPLAERKKLNIEPNTKVNIVAEDDRTICPSCNRSHREALPRRPWAQALCVDKSQPVKVQHQAHIGPVIPIGREVHMILPQRIGEDAHSLGQAIWGHALDEFILPHGQIDCILNGTTLKTTREGIDTAHADSRRAQPRHRSQRAPRRERRCHGLTDHVPIMGATAEPATGS